MTITAHASLLLAQTTTNDTGPEFGKASPLGLVVIVVLLVGTALLIRSMNGRLKKLPETFEPSDPTPDQAADDGTDAPATSDTAASSNRDSDGADRPR